MRAMTGRALNLLLVMCCFASRLGVSGSADPSGDGRLRVGRRA